MVIMEGLLLSFLVRRSVVYHCQPICCLFFSTDDEIDSFVVFSHTFEFWLGNDT